MLMALAFSNYSFAQQKEKPAATVKKATTAKPASRKPVVKGTLKKTVITKPKPTRPTIVKPLTVDDLKMTGREKQMVDEINLVRSDPAGYIKYVKEYIKKTNAGKGIKAAANELMDELKHLSPLNKLQISPKLYVDAKNYGKQLVENNSIEHSDLPYSENLSFGIENIRDAIIDLLIDDGISERGHRKNILKKNITMIGVVELEGKVEDYPHCYVQEFK